MKLSLLRSVLSLIIVLFVSKDSFCQSHKSDSLTVLRYYSPKIPLDSINYFTVVFSENGQPMRHNETYNRSYRKLRNYWELKTKLTKYGDLLLSSTVEQFNISNKGVQVSKTTSTYFQPKNINGAVYKKPITVFHLPIAKDSIYTWESVEDGDKITCSALYYSLKIENESFDAIIIRKDGHPHREIETYLKDIGFVQFDKISYETKKYILRKEITAVDLKKLVLNAKRIKELESPKEADKVPVPKVEESPVVPIVETQPEYVGGMAALGKYLSKNLIYPKQAQMKNVSGRVFVSFVVNEDGSLSDVIALSGPGSGTEAEAVRLVSAMPNWIPGKQNGKPVRTKYNLPINFTQE